MVLSTRLLTGIFFWGHVSGIGTPRSVLAGRVEKRQTPGPTPVAMPPFREYPDPTKYVPPGFNITPEMIELQLQAENGTLSKYMGSPDASKQTFGGHSLAFHSKETQLRE
jgi:hypothetical protein